MDIRKIFALFDEKFARNLNDSSMNTTSKNCREFLRREKKRKEKVMNLKKVTILLIAAIFVLTACEQKGVYKTPEEIYEHIAENAQPELPLMLDISEERLPDYKVNTDDAKLFVAKEAAISAVFVQLIFIEANKDKVSEVYNAMLEHQAQLKEAAFYPQAQQASANSRVGFKGELVYLICHEGAQEIEDILTEFCS
ncbi:MAG: hypothetical protein FWF94_05960 [Oscillospiraceae bacterium]|nr:hypothetical protein [Oscillospiraceae bacterium]